MNEFVWPSDFDRAESDELNRVCQYAEELWDEVGRLQTQIESFKSFTDAMLGISWQGNDVDGAVIQELAIKNGLLKQIVQTGPCSDVRCICAEVAEFPINCNRKTYLDEGGDSHAS